MVHGPYWKQSEMPQAFNTNSGFRDSNSTFGKRGYGNNTRWDQRRLTKDDWIMTHAITVMVDGHLTHYTLRITIARRESCTSRNAKAPTEGPRRYRLLEMTRRLNRHFATHKTRLKRALLKRGTAVMDVWKWWPE